MWKNKAQIEDRRRRMKAYFVWIENRYDAGNEIIFAKNTKEARNLAHTTQIAGDADRFIDVRVKRYPAFDDKENLNARDFIRLQLDEGWHFDQGYIDGNCTDKEFDLWYERNFENREDKR